METFTKTKTLSVAPEMGTLSATRWRGSDAFCADASDDEQAISPEHWRAWEEKTRLRGKANARKLTIVASAALLILWLICMVAGYTFGGSLHILPLIAVVALAIHVFQSRRSIL